MDFNKYKSLKDAKRQLIEEGFTSEFILTEGKLRASDTGKEYSFKDMEIVRFQRFRIVPNLGHDASVIFAVRCNDGVKGTVVSSDKTYGDIKLAEFMDKVKIENRENVPNR